MNNRASGRFKETCGRARGKVRRPCHNGGFASACGRFDKREVGLSVLDQARERLAASGLKPRSVAVRRFSGFLDRCRRRLDGGEAAETGAAPDCDGE